jgi:hypothetical protein
VTASSAPSRPAGRTAGAFATRSGRRAGRRARSSVQTHTKKHARRSQPVRASAHSLPPAARRRREKKTQWEPALCALPRRLYRSRTCVARHGVRSPVRCRRPCGVEVPGVDRVSAGAGAVLGGSCEGVTAHTEGTDEKCVVDTRRPRKKGAGRAGTRGARAWRPTRPTPCGRGSRVTRAGGAPGGAVSPVAGGASFSMAHSKTRSTRRRAGAVDAPVPAR